MKKVIAMMLVMAISASCVACSSGGEKTDSSSADASTTEITEEAGTITDDLSALEAVGDIDVDENLLSVTITLPAEYTDPEMTQEDYDAAAKETDGIKSATLNDDGSVTYVMTKARHRQMLQEIVDQYTEQNNAMIGSEDYPNITDIKANDDFTEFTVTTTSTELSLMESLSVLQFYVEGGMYGIMSGKSVDNIHIDFVNADTGEIIDSADSSNMVE